LDRFEISFLLTLHINTQKTMDYSAKKILYIEDDRESREMMADILRIHGFNYLEASRGIEGIRIATQYHPDLILMDLNLPDMNGYEITTLLKSIPNLKKTPIIALSADAKRDAKEFTLTAGCEGFIAKPINIADFLQRINEYLQGKKEIIAPELERKYLTEFNIRLGEKLHNKIEELEKVNQNLLGINDELKRSRQQLTDYNNRLFTMNNLANSLRLQESPEDVLNILPEKLVEGFQVDRVIIFQYDEKSEKLDPHSYAGVTVDEVKKLKLKLERIFYLQLKSELKILWVKNRTEILNRSLHKFALRLQSDSFILGSFSAFASRRDASGIFQNVVVKANINKNNENNLGTSKKLLIFLDRGHKRKNFITYEIRVIKAFLQTASIIYENMNLYHNLLKMLKIRERQAVTDPITEVHNYRYFQNQIEREIGRSQRHKKTFSIAMIDIDNFKEYNDTHGHFNGDLALKLIAQSLHENIRKSDILARYGGDEFIIILPELDKNQAKKLAEKLCDVISKTTLPAKKRVRKVNLTISLGIASFPSDGTQEETLLKKADEALYSAKESGRNTVSISV